MLKLLGSNVVYLLRRSKERGSMYIALSLSAFLLASVITNQAFASACASYSFRRAHCRCLLFSLSAVLS